MDESSVTRSVPPSTKVLVAGEGLCKQVAALLLCEVQPIRNAFIGEPVEDVLAMVQWTLSHEDDEGFDPAKVLTNWAKKRSRGVWGEKPGRAARVVWGEQDPEDVDLDGEELNGNGDGVPEDTEREIALHIAELYRSVGTSASMVRAYHDTSGVAHTRYDARSYDVEGGLPEDTKEKVQEWVESKQGRPRARRRASGFLGRSPP